jgi:hypothetical protein
VRVGDFGLELVGRDSDLREVDTGHVLARPGAVYGIRLRNFGPLRCVVAVELDGKAVTAGGLVLRPYAVCTLERPIDDREHGRFTVVAEGDERVFGPDGGRDNADLGLIEASFRRELPGPQHERFTPAESAMPPAIPMPESSRMQPARPLHRPPHWQNRLSSFDGGMASSAGDAVSSPMRPRVTESEGAFDSIQRAAGTGLTGHSDQEFITVTMGSLEAEATTLRLRLVIGSEEAITSPRPLRATDDVPARPAARP